MKVLPFLLLFFSFICNSQKSYPYLYEDSVGQQFVILTLDQAQKLDNSTEFSPILWKDHTSYYQLVDSLCERKLESKNIQIETLKRNIDTISHWYTTYMKSYELCENRVAILNNRKDISDEINNSLKQQIANLEETNKNTQSELKKSKRDMNLAIVFGIVSTVVLFIISL